jgi:DNA repair exonuclease SbcCD ATPase subunit
MSSAIPASELISNLASAQQSMEAANEAYENWRHEYQNNEASLRAAMERHASLQAEEKKRQQDIKEGQKTVTAANAALAAFYRSAAAPLDAGYASPAELPASPQIPPTPFKKRMTKDEKKAMSPEVKRAFKQFKAAEAAIRKANRTPEEQAKIDERVAKMKAARDAKKAVGGSVEGSDAEGAIATA